MKVSILISLILVNSLVHAGDAELKLQMSKTLELKNNGVSKGINAPRFNSINSLPVNANENNSEYYQSTHIKNVLGTKENLKLELAKAISLIEQSEGKPEIEIDNQIDDASMLKNDKEVEINAFSSREKDKVISRLKKQPFGFSVNDIFAKSVNSFLKDEPNRCEFNLIERLQTDFSKAGLKKDKEEMEIVFKSLRINQQIDDLFYEILVSLNEDYSTFKSLDVKKSGSRTQSKILMKELDLKELFGAFTDFPDESELCMFREYAILKSSLLAQKTEKEKIENLLKEAIQTANYNKIIDNTTFHKIEFIRSKSEYVKKNIWLRDYLKIAFSAKNKLMPITKTYVTNDITKEDKYPSEKIKRFSKLTRRGLLYQKYDETQIIMLSQVLIKASRRMGADPDTVSSIPVIVQEFDILEKNGERKNHVEKIELDPQSQYNLARRLMRKDILELQMMDSFKKVTVTYQDVVLAAYETGYINHEDLEYVVQYDDLWNPNKTKFEKMTGFVFKVAGYSTFFVPPPWNVVTTIALGVVEGVVENKFLRTGVDNDNAATFIE